MILTKKSDHNLKHEIFKTINFFLKLIYIKFEILFDFQIIFERN